MEELNSVIFEIDNRKFIIEFIIFTIAGLKCCHVEFGQKIGPFIAQFTLNNMPKYSALYVLRKVVYETVDRYRDFDMVVFSSLDGNLKRNAIYDRIAKDMVKREHCDVSYIEMEENSRIFILHRNCYDSNNNDELLSYLSKNGLFSISGRLLMLYFKIINIGKRFLKFRYKYA